jgi:integrase
MAKQTTKYLTAREVSTLNEPGRYVAAPNLYLVIGKGGARSWTLLITVAGKRREIGLGSLRDVSLADARKKAEAMRVDIANGKDPLTAKKQKAHATTFGAFAGEWVHARATRWRGAQTKAQALAAFRNHAAKLADMPLDRIETKHVLAVLTPLWQEKPIIAGKLQNYIERILDAARVAGLRSRDNPARWRYHLDHIFQAKHDHAHHAAMPYEKVPGWFAGCTNDCLKFVVLTAMRSGEVRGARWDEIKGDVWEVPGARMKNGRPHRVPLSDAAQAILDRQPRTGPFIFGNGRMFGTILMRVLRGTGATVHGFRSSFRDFVADRTDFPSEIAEQALAHTVGSAVERAYRRTDMFEKRRQLMQTWSDFVTGVQV